MFVYVSPVHVNVHQESCLWLVEFIHGVVKTVNIELALSVKDEGKSFLVIKCVCTHFLVMIEVLSASWLLLCCHNYITGRNEITIH